MVAFFQNSTSKYFLQLFKSFVRNFNAFNTQFDEIQTFLLTIETHLQNLNLQKYQLPFLHFLNLVFNYHFLKL
jgi:hypothetical protein